MKSFIPILLVAAGLTGTAHAEDAKKARETRAFVNSFAKCVVEQHHDKAAEMILAYQKNATIIRRYRRLLDGECMCKSGGAGRALIFSNDLFRYALADALVNADFLSTGEADFSNRLPLTHSRTDALADLQKEMEGAKSKRRRAEIEKDNNRLRAIEWLSNYGECVVRHDPIRARQWLLTPIDTPEEASRIDDLRPVFSNCLGDGALKFSRATIRGTVAMNYYRLAKATPQQLAEEAR